MCKMHWTHIHFVLLHTLLLFSRSLLCCSALVGWSRWLWLVTPRQPVWASPVAPALRTGPAPLHLRSASPAWRRDSWRRPRRWGLATVARWPWRAPRWSRRRRTCTPGCWALVRAACSAESGCRDTGSQFGLRGCRRSRNLRAVWPSWAARCVRGGTRRSCRRRTQFCQTREALWCWQNLQCVWPMQGSLDSH